MDKIHAAMIEHLCQMASRAGYFDGNIDEARAYYANANVDNMRGFQPQHNTFACWGTAKVLNRLEGHVRQILIAAKRNEDPELSPRVVAYYRRHLHTA